MCNSNPFIMIVCISFRETVIYTAAWFCGFKTWICAVYCSTHCVYCEWYSCSLFTHVRVVELHWGEKTCETLTPVLNTPNRSHTNLGEVWNSTFIEKVRKKNHTYAFYICLVKNTELDLVISVEIYKMAIFSYTLKTAVSPKVAIAQPNAAEENHVH